MTFDEIFETLPGNGWLSKPEAALLWRCLKLVGTGNVLEVGCFEGRATCLLAQGVPGIVHVVDPFAGFSTEDPDGARTHEAFLENAGAFSNVRLHKVRIEDWEPRPVDLAYLDGDHTYEGTLAQINKALACAPKTIAVHDVNDGGGGLEVKRACLRALGCWDERVDRLAVWKR